MPTHSEAVRLNLEYYRKQAKALLKAAMSGAPEARERFSRHLPNFDLAAVALHDAQLAVARPQGFRSWPRFRAFMVQSALDYQGVVASFIDAAVSDLRRAEELLAAHPQIADAGFYVALLLGDAMRVAHAVAETPSLAASRGGPQDCAPLVYVCFSRFASGNARHADGLVETARFLLRHGADPNAFTISANLPDNPLSCLYAATGLNNNPALALALLEAGANPNDGESLYHSTEHPDLECMKLLLRYGATPAGANALKHILDYEHFEGLELLLAAGADPNETNDRGETALHWAVWRGRGTPIIAALLDHGAGVDAKRKDGRTAYVLAVQSGQAEIAALLAARGASTDLSVLEHIDRGSLLSDLAMNLHAPAVRALLAAGAPVNALGEMGATALHWACWKGDAQLVELLLNHGASLTIEDERFHATPPGWFGHGVHNCGESHGDYAQVARLLIAAGAKIPAVDLPTGKSDVDAVLREHGLI